MDEGRICSRWFLAAILALPVIQWTFGYPGLWVLQSVLPAGLRPFGPGFAWWRATIFGAGIGLVLILSYIAVGHRGAPRQLWFVAFAWAVLPVLFVVGSVGPVWVISLTVPYSMASQLQQVLFRSISGLPFSDPRAYFLVPVGYLLASGLGCWLGAEKSAAAAAGASLEDSD